MSKTQTEALTRQEPQLELTHDGRGNDRAIARAANGKFATRHKAAIKKSIKDVISFLEGRAVDPETGNPSNRTRHEAILQKFYDAMMNATAEELVGLSKAYAELQRAAYGSKGKDNLIEQTDPDSNKVRFVIITQPDLPNKEFKREIPTPTKPSWIDAEIVSTNPPKDPNAES